MEIILFGVGIFIIWKALSWLSETTNRAKLYDELKPRLDSVEKRESLLKQEKIELEILAKEKSKGFPWLAGAYADYYHLQDMKTANWLENKSHPARKAADTVREISESKRNTEKLFRTLKYQIEYYETLFPWLSEFKDDDIDDLLLQVSEKKSDGSFLTDENDDPAKRWLTESEYSSLSTVEKYQRALDRYWVRRKTRWEIGRDYERFIGYQYENQGWQVQYQGIVEGFSDLGRDLIATRGNEVQVIQCKYWSREKTIHEKHIFQLYGTSVAYKIDNPRKNVHAVFVTSTVVSDRAKQFANALNLTCRESKPLEQYPCIKCNISKKDGTKIYHLPFDQQYDTTVIEPNSNEKFVTTVYEAETLGFRRAFRWRGN